MYPVSNEILSVLGRSHRVTSRLRASVNGSPFTYPVKLESGEVTVDGRRPIRRQLAAEIQADIDDPECDTFRTEVKADYGINLPGQPTYWIPVGTFVVTEAQEVGRGKVAIKGEDRWRRIMNARFLQPTTTIGLHTTAIVSLMQGADGRILCYNETTKTGAHRRSVWDRDRDKTVLSLAEAIGVDVYFDADGAARIREVPSIMSSPVLNIGGNDGGTLIETKRGKKQGNTYNAVVVEGENASGDVAVRAIAKVTSATSPIQFGGAFAQRPRFLRSSLITTQAQANGAAASMLSKVTGISKTVSIDTFPLAMMESGDVILLEVVEGVWEKHIVDAFNIPLALGTTQMSTRTPFEDAEGE